MNPLLLGGIFDIGKSLIDRLIPDPEQKAKAQIELLKMQQDGEFKELETRMSAILAEANSADPWTSRARPAFLYVMYIMILSALPMGFLSAFEPQIAMDVAEGMKMWLAALPGELYALFGAGYLGYAHYRTNEKKMGIAR